MSQLDLSHNALCGVTTNMRGRPEGTCNAEGIKAIADALRVAGSLRKLDARYNSMGEEVKAALRKAIQERCGFELKL